MLHFLFVNCKTHPCTTVTSMEYQHAILLAGTDDRTALTS